MPFFYALNLGFGFPSIPELETQSLGFCLEPRTGLSVPDSTELGTPLRQARQLAS